MIGERRIEIVGYLSQGWTAKEISEKLGLSRRTVEKHVEMLKWAHGARNQTHLVAIWLREKLIE